MVDCDFFRNYGDFTPCRPEFSETAQHLIISISDNPASVLETIIKLLTARFTDRSTGNPLTVRYQFRDDPISPSPNTTHTYYQPGTSTVSLTVWGTGDLKPVSNITLLQNLIVVT